jgi:hypothetical protein
MRLCFCGRQFPKINGLRKARVARSGSTCKSLGTTEMAHTVSASQAIFEAVEVSQGSLSSTFVRPIQDRPGCSRMGTPAFGDYAFLSASLTSCTTEYKTYGEQHIVLLTRPPPHLAIICSSDCVGHFVFDALAGYHTTGGRSTPTLVKDNKQSYSASLFHTSLHTIS